MPKLYNQYCYNNLSSVKDSIRSQMSIDGFGIVQTVSNTGGIITVEYIDSNLILSTFDFKPPNCTKLGFDNSYFGIDTPDAIILGSEISLVLVIAWSIKILRRTL